MTWPFPHPSEDTHTLHCFNPHRNRGGVCIIWRKTTPYKSDRMVELALSYCSSHDSYSKKIGRTIALRHWNHNQRILVPAWDENVEYTEYNLHKMFWSSLL